MLQLPPITLARMDDEVIPIVFFAASAVFGVVWLFTHCIRSVLTHAQTERSRREIAAYIAEGSMTPEDGARLMAAGLHKPGSPVPPPRA